MDIEEFGHLHGLVEPEVVGNLAPAVIGRIHRAVESNVNRAILEKMSLADKSTRKEMNTPPASALSDWYTRD
jgi:hypothetical protein